jgi:hypothetical protein
MLADIFDPYLGYINPSSRTICFHYDADPMYYVSDANAAGMSRSTRPDRSMGR